MKDCIILGHCTALTYKNVFPLLVDKVLNVTERSVHFGEVNTRWFSTFRWVPKDRIKLTETYSPEKYQKYDNYDAIECGNKKDIPTDYSGKIGVPGTFFFWHPELDYEILEHRGDLKLNGKTVFQRMIIRKK